MYDIRASICKFFGHEQNFACKTDRLRTSFALFLRSCFNKILSQCEILKSVSHVINMSGVSQSASNNSTTIVINHVFANVVLYKYEYNEPRGKDLEGRATIRWILLFFILLLAKVTICNCFISNDYTCFEKRSKLRWSYKRKIWILTISRIINI